MLSPERRGCVGTFGRYICRVVVIDEWPYKDVRWLRCAALVVCSLYQIAALGVCCCLSGYVTLGVYCLGRGWNVPSPVVVRLQGCTTLAVWCSITTFDLTRLDMHFILFAPVGS